MRLPSRLAPQHPLRKVIASLLIALLCTLGAFGLHRTPGAAVALGGLDQALYDAFYHFRKPEDRKAGGVVIVTVDEVSLEKLATAKHIQWPWPRIFWANLIHYLQSCGARAVAFDIIFKEPRAFDEELGDAIDQATIPVIMANRVLDDGALDAFAPQAHKPPTFGAVNIVEDKVIRRYTPIKSGRASLALQTVRAIGAPLPAWAQQPFLLHYYGPMTRKDGTFTYRYIAAYGAVKAAGAPKTAASVNISPGMFKDKIVLVGTSANAIFDVKASPLTPVCPGVEVHATAIDNLLNGQCVWPLQTTAAAGVTFLATFLAALGVTLPQRASMKVALGSVALMLLLLVAVGLFIGKTIHWLPLASPLLAAILSLIGAFAWSYLTEDRQRRLVLKALSQYVSPHVADEIARDPSALRLGGQRREMTVMFSDIQGFTDLSETLESQKLSELLNFYLGEMSAMILAHDGTLDKYIGDAIMSFWNAPIRQADHAAGACRAALAMRSREAEIQSQLAAMGASRLLTRIGINTGPMVFGNMGSPQKFNYSVLGDSVNLASRLEGANKFYGSRILIAESTARAVGDQFVVRQLDLLRVKGKLQPIAVFELMDEGKAAGDLAERVKLYEQALGLYRRQQWEQAAAILDDLHRRFPDDHPAAALRKRIDLLRDDPPGSDWDGVYVAKDK